MGVFNAQSVNQTAPRFISGGFKERQTCLEDVGKIESGFERAVPFDGGEQPHAYHRKYVDEYEHQTADIHNLGKRIDEGRIDDLQLLHLSEKLK